MAAYSSFNFFSSLLQQGMFICLICVIVLFQSKLLLLTKRLSDLWLFKKYPKKARWIFLNLIRFQAIAYCFSGITWKEKKLKNTLSQIKKTVIMDYSGHPTEVVRNLCWSYENKGLCCNMFESSGFCSLILVTFCFDFV